MIQARRILVLVFPMLILACRSTVLPADEIPSDFVFGYEYNRTTDAPPSNEVGAPAGEGVEMPAEEGMEMPAAEGEEMPAEEGMDVPAEEGMEMPAAEGEEMPAEEGMDVPAEEAGEMPAEEGTEMPAEEGAGEPMAEPLPVEQPVPVPAEPAVAPVGMLQQLKFEVRASGVVEYLIVYDDADRTTKSGRTQLDDQALRRVYDRVREADLPGMKSRHIGDDPTLGRETYHLIGAGLREFWIDVEGVRVEELTRLWNDVLRMLPDRELLLPPAPETKAFLLDRTTGKIHRVNCKRAEDVAAGARMPLPHAEAGLNLGGYPCEECRPLSK